MSMKEFSRTEMDARHDIREDECECAESECASYYSYNRTFSCFRRSDRIGRHKNAAIQNGNNRGGH